MQGIFQKKQKAKIKSWGRRSILAIFAFCPSPAWAQPSSLSLEGGTFLVFHPVFVHFAIALLLFGFVVDWSGSLLEQRQTQAAGRLSFLAGVVALGLATMTGWIEHELPRPAGMFDTQMQTTLFRHEYLGYGLCAFFLVLAIMRMRIRGRLPVLFLLLGVLGSVGLLFQGYLGGELVYRYGAGVRAVQVLSGSATEPGQKKAPE